MKILSLLIMLFSAFTVYSQEVFKDSTETAKAHSFLETVKKKGKFISQLDSSYVIDLPKIDEHLRFLWMVKAKIITEHLLSLMVMYCH